MYEIKIVTLLKGADGECHVTIDGADHRCSLKDGTGSIQVDLRAGPTRLGPAILRGESSSGVRYVEVFRMN